MIPVQLTLKNFLSYQQASLDFEGLHTACICGANGAGKSSLLEAITWAIWGQSRASSDDDVIHGGSEDVRVDFIFESNGQIYRVIRSRRRGRGSGLDFQVKSENQFRSLSGKGIRATQEQIHSHLKLDYDTFVNSSYLRQGRADEFMLRRPAERKQILADLLKLNQYETLSTKAKDYSKQLKGQIEQLSQSLAPIEEQLKERVEIKKEENEVIADIEKIQIIQDRDRASLQNLQSLDSQRQTWQQQMILRQTQYQDLTKDCDLLAKDVAKVKGDISQLEELLNQTEEITTGYNELVRLQQEQESFATKFQTYQDNQHKKQKLAQQLEREINNINLKIQQTKTNLDNLQQREAELVIIINQEEEVKASVEKLRSYRQRLDHLDQLQLEVSPLFQRRQSLQGEIGQAQARLNAKLEQNQHSSAQFSTQLAQVPELRQSVLNVDSKVRELDKKRVRKQCVEEQGSERKELRTRIEAEQKNYQQQIAELEQKLAMLQTPDSVCPLCDRELDEHHRNHVIEKTQNQQQEIEQLYWLLQEQMSSCERELQELRLEYTELNQSLEAYDNLLQKRGQLEAQLENTFDIHERMAEISAESEKIEQSLTAGHYALDLHEELHQLEAKLKTLSYDEQTHALVRSEVKNLQWAERKQDRIDDAIKEKQRLGEKKPQREEEIAALENSILQLRQNSPLQQEIAACEQSIQALGYDRDRHNQVISALRNAQSWQLRYSQLQAAQQQQPQLESHLQERQNALQERLKTRDERKGEIEKLTAEMENMSDYSGDIELLEAQIRQQRQELDGKIREQARLGEKLTQLKALEQQNTENRKQLQYLQKQQRVYTELTQAFGKNGIQALMIENMLPQLEAQTNLILARLTNNQLHVQFLTQKVGKSSSKKNTKLIDTLEIVIADAQGTRAYETYSGGESFRINFAIRLALAQLLAQRAGTSLQMLIIDEGFGTQDAQGCDRLIAAINAIAPDFSCILAVTHMPQFKEAFQNRIEVHKTTNGSELSLVS